MALASAPGTENRFSWSCLLICLRNSVHLCRQHSLNRSPIFCQNICAATRQPDQPRSPATQVGRRAGDNDCPLGNFLHLHHRLPVWHSASLGVRRRRMCCRWKTHIRCHRLQHSHRCWSRLLLRPHHLEASDEQVDAQGYHRPFRLKVCVSTLLAEFNFSFFLSF